MKVIARVWHQAFSMKDLKSVVKFYEKTVDVKVKDGYAAAMMKAAIGGSKSFSGEFKRFVDLDGHDAREALARMIGKEVIEGACRVTLEFQGLPQLEYVMTNLFGAGEDRHVGDLVARDTLKPIL